MNLLVAQSGLWHWLTTNERQGEGELRFQWAALPESWGVFVWLLLAGIVAFGIVWMYVREAGSTSARGRAILTGLRLTTVFLLILLLFKPSVFYQQVSIVRPAIAVLRDNSISLVRGDQYKDADTAKRLAEVSGFGQDRIAAGEISRQQLVDRLTGSGNPELLRKIRLKANLNVRDFSVNTTKAGSMMTIFEKAISQSAAEDPAPDAASSIAPLACNGAGTDLWQALRDALDSGDQLAGIVIVSDGQHNGSEDPRVMAKRAGELEIPVFTIGVGDPNPRRNFSVEEVFVRSQVYPGESFEIESLVQANLPENDSARGTEMEVALLQRSVGSDGKAVGQGTEVAKQNVAVPAIGSRIRVDFDHVIAEPGNYVFSVVARSTGQEETEADNTKTSRAVQVVNEQIRVLLIAGQPNWEYIQLQRLLQRDPTVSLSCWLQSMDPTRPQEGDESISALPRSLLDIGQYNMVIMIDPNPEEFDSEWVANLQEYVRNQSGGLMYMAGSQYAAEFLTMNRLSGLRDMLPVRFGDSASITASQIIAEASDSGVGSMQIVKHNLDHPIMSFHTNLAENEMRWSQFRGFAWNFPTISAKPNSRVLIEAGTGPNLEDNQPVLVTGPFGGGNVVYFGFMGTWLWRSAGVQAQYFDRFWIQVVRYLVENRSLQGSRRGFVDSDMTEYELGGRITLLARIKDEQFKPLIAEFIPVVMTDDAGRIQKLNLQPVPGQPGQYEGSLLASRTGTFSANFDVPGVTNAAELFEAAAFRVVPPSVELDSDWLDEPMMQDIAALSGGSYLPLDRINELPELLPRLETRAEFNSPSQPAWDLNRLRRYGAYLLVLTLLCAEWGLRKWYRMM